MLESPMDEAHKRALIAAYYLSRFDRKGIHALGYATATEAFDHIGTALGVKPTTVKHMRDSFDPYCSQVRAGWHQRPILRSRANVIQAYDELSEAAISEIVREILNGTQQDACQFTAPISLAENSQDESTVENNAYANRLRTGETAETFFIDQFPSLKMFQGSELEDTRKLGIGFDFKAMFPSTHFMIEVKGVRELSGYVSFTDKEWSLALRSEDRFILALVRNLDKQPNLELIPNPTTILKATMRAIESISVCWNARV